MKFAKIVFLIAGVYGVVVLLPMYFIYDMIGRLGPPPITHPQFYYGFVGVTLVWQFAYGLVGFDPARFRPTMILCAAAKFSYVFTVIALYLQRRMTPVQAVTAAREALLGLLFLAAFFKKGLNTRHPQPLISN